MSSMSLRQASVSSQEGPGAAEKSNMDIEAKAIPEDRSNPDSVGSREELGERKELMYVSTVSFCSPIPLLHLVVAC